MCFACPNGLPPLDFRWFLAMVVVIVSATAVVLAIGWFLGLGFNKRLDLFILAMDRVSPSLSAASTRADSFPSFPNLRSWDSLPFGSWAVVGSCSSCSSLQVVAVRLEARLPPALWALLFFPPATVSSSSSVRRRWSRWCLTSESTEPYLRGGRSYVGGVFPILKI